MLKSLMLAICLVVALATTPVRGAEAPHAAVERPDHPVEKATGASGEAEHGKPHDLIEFDKNSAIWVVIVFIVLLAILYPTGWKSVLAGLKAREERIRKDIADAEAARAKSEQTLRDYQKQLATAEDKVREIIGGATAQAEQIAASIRAKAQQEGEEAKNRANREIEEAKHQALAEIYQSAAELSTSIAGKILRRTINADDHRELVKQSIDELGKM